MTNDLNPMSNTPVIIDIIGKGKVGEHLLAAFSSVAECDCRIVNSRTLAEMRNDADIAFIAVTDTAIPMVAEAMKEFRGVLAHVSGSTPMSALWRTSKAGVFYPFQSFSKGVEVDFSQVPLLVEASDEESLSLLKQVAGMLSSQVIEADGEKRKMLHLAGVFSCNFLNEMMVAGYDIMDKAGLPESLLKPLISMTVSKALANDPRNVRTGPAARRDMNIIAAQEKLLDGNKLLLDVYKSVTALILDN